MHEHAGAPMGRPPGEWRKTAFGRQVRDALGHLHDVPYLQTHPLVRTVLAPRDARSANAGQLLRRRLAQAIDALQPRSDLPATSAVARSYRLLKLRYLDGREIAEVCAELALSESQYHRVHGRCLDAIVSLLEGDRLDVPPNLTDAAASGEAARGRAGPGPGALPSPMTSFIGRAPEVAEVRRLLVSARLLTLTGPPGVGKTRLARELAAREATSYPDGVFFVPLAETHDPSLVVSTIARALALQEYGERPLPEHVTGFLREKGALLVVDNFEHVIAAAAFVAELLRTSARLRMLVTSRVPLRLYGEQEFAVPPLALPDRARLSRVPAPDALAVVDESAAVRLFVERCRAVQPGFALHEENALTVAEICHRLDGLPLAIELAATRIKLFPPQALLARLQRRLDLLNRGPADAPARHQTLRAAIDWSYGLLTPSEQLVFRRLAVFVGGCTLEAATAVAGDGGQRTGDGEDPHPSPLPFDGRRNGDSASPGSLERAQGGEDVPPVPRPLSAVPPEEVAALVDKSLLRLETDAAGEPRLRMLETIAEFADERLLESGEAEEMRRRHARYFLALAEEIAPRLEGAAQVAWLDRIEREHDNLRAALRWATARGETALGLRLGCALGRFWWARGHWSEGRAGMSELLSSLNLEEVRRHGRSAGNVSLATLAARALYVTGTVAWWQRDYRAARPLFSESLALGREWDDLATIAHASVGLGLVEWSEGNSVAARARFEESLAWRAALGDCWIVALGLWLAGIGAYDHRELAVARRLYEDSLGIFRRLGDRWGIAQVLNSLGLLANREGNDAVARSFHDESLAIKRELRDRWGVAQSLNSLGISARGQGDHPAARSHHKEALAIWRDLGDQAGCVWSLHNLGAIALAEGNPSQAGARYRECLAISRELGDRAGMSTSLEGLAVVAAARQQSACALHLAGAAEALRAAAGSPLSAADREQRDRRLATAWQALGQVDGETALARGRTMPLEQAIATALAVAMGETEFTRHDHQERR